MTKVASVMDIMATVATDMASFTLPTSIYGLDWVLKMGFIIEVGHNLNIGVFN